MAWSVRAVFDLTRAWGRENMRRSRTRKWHSLFPAVASDPLAHRQGFRASVQHRIGLHG